MYFRQHERGDGERRRKDGKEGRKARMDGWMELCTKEDRMKIAATGVVGRASAARAASGEMVILHPLGEVVAGRRRRAVVVVVVVVVVSASAHFLRVCGCPRPRLLFWRQRRTFGSCWTRGFGNPGKVPHEATRRRAPSPSVGNERGASCVTAILRERHRHRGRTSPISAARLLPALVTREAPRPAVVVIIRLVVVGVRDRFKGWRDAPDGQFRPVDRGEKGMTLQFGGAALRT